MPIRAARRSDWTRMSTIGAAAFHSEHLFGEVMHPHRDQYPDDFAGFWLRKIRASWWDCTHIFLVATAAVDGERGQEAAIGEVLVGWAEWVRRGTGGRKYALRVWDPRRLLQPLAGLYNSATLLLRPNLAASPDPSAASLLERGIQYSKHYWEGERAENWYLEALCVHPDFQGQGFGRELVEWGLENAAEEGVFASVMASDGKDAFYKHVGFSETVGWATEGEGNPLNGIRGGAIMFRDFRKDAAAGSRGTD